MIDSFKPLEPLDSLESVESTNSLNANSAANSATNSAAWSASSGVASEADADSGVVDCGATATEGRDLSPQVKPQTNMDVNAGQAQKDRGPAMDKAARVGPVGEGTLASRLTLTRDLKRPTEYVHQLNGEFAEFALNEERAPKFKGTWRSDVFGVGADHPVDLEIGTGNGYFFAHLAKTRPERALLGIEIKFKPLIQSIRRALRAGGKHVRIMRYDASHLEDLFAPCELNDVIIHHPDPWPKKRQWKHRLIQTDFLLKLHSLQRPGAIVDFKTDSEDYYDWAIERFRSSPYEVVREARDLHRSEWASENFVTHFESIFLKKGQPIFYARLLKRP